MFSLTTLTAISLALFDAVHGAPQKRDQFPDKYNVVEVSWELPVNLREPNDTTKTVTGTIQEAVAKMEADYAGWNDVFQAQLPLVSNTAIDTPSIGMHRRPDDMPQSWDCNLAGNGEASLRRAVEGADYLRILGSVHAKNGPGPDNCGRVSCSYDASIWWCNNDSHEKEVWWSQIADAAYFVIGSCGDRDKKTVKGRVNYADNWYLVILWDKC